MKIFFFLQRRFAYVGHAIALTLKEQYGVQEFCGYAYLRSSFDFLKSQNEIRYTKLLLDEEVLKGYVQEPLDLAYLKTLETEYGLPNLWPYLEIDRVIRHGQLIREYPYDKPPYTHEEMMRILQVKTKVISAFLKEEKPDLMLFSVIADLSSLFLYHAAKKMGIKTLFMQEARTGMRYTLTEDYRTLSYIEETFGNIQGGTTSYPRERRLAEEFLRSFRSKPLSYSYEDTAEKKPLNRKKQFAFLNPKQFFASLAWTYTTFIEYCMNRNKDDYSVVKPWHYVWDRLKRKIRVLVGFDDLYDETDPDDAYVFFPLQFEPEMFASLFSGFYTDQLWLVRQIARAVPIEFKVYVKEHPAMYGYRPKSFYRELKNIPNVKLIRPTEKTFDLIRNARLITTLTGTVGWEAILFKKPVVTFGDVFYNVLPAAKKCAAIDDLPFLIKDQLERFTHDEHALINFLTAVFKESVDFDIIRIWEMEGGGENKKHKEQFERIAELIARKVNPTPAAQ